MALKFYAIVAKGLKLNVREVLGDQLLFVEVTEKKLVGGGGELFAPIPNRVKEQHWNEYLDKNGFKNKFLSDLADSLHSSQFEGTEYKFDIDILRFYI